MLSAFVEETKELSLDMVQEVTGELEKENRYWQDEAPETYFSANQDTLKEIVNRVGRLEEESFKKNISENEKIEIFERLSSTETLLNKFITSIKTEMFNLQGKMASSKDEINSIREKIMALGSMAKDIQSELAEFRNRLILRRMKQITDEKRKKGLFRSIFHKQTDSHH
jgi:chromosome segregation ATPase